MHCLLTMLSLWSLLYQTDDTFVIRLEHFPLANKFLRITFNYQAYTDNLGYVSCPRQSSLVALDSCDPWGIYSFLVK